MAHGARDVAARRTYGDRERSMSATMGSWSYKIRNEEGQEHTFVYRDKATAQKELAADIAAGAVVSELVFLPEDGGAR